MLNNKKSLKTEKELKIGSIGGGSGNDALSLSLFFRKYCGLEAPIKVEILDYSHSAWKKCNQDLLTKIYSGPPENIAFDWSFGDFKNDMGSFSSKTFVALIKRSKIIYYCLLGSK